ncbi:MAG TPA: STAS domain-containing protein [Pilimelia sp.]|nr:STAS domain-containing protein [Pilimelia sp.]
MTTALHLTTGQTPDGAPQLTAVGEIDISNCAEFAGALAEAIGPGRRLLVDLTRVEYLDSAALAVLFAHAEHVDVRVSPLNEALLTISGLTALTTVEVVTSPAEPDPH